MLQAANPVETRRVPVLLLPIDLVDSPLDIPEPPAEDLIFVARTLQQMIFLCLRVRCGFGPSACFPLARELRKAHAEQLRFPVSDRFRHNHQLADSELLAFPKHERLFGQAPSIGVETILDFPKQVHELLVTAALLRGKACELRLLS
jgi:hypothetical protein